MAFNKKTWVDRQVQHPDRRTLVDVETNVARTYDVTRDEGYVAEEGDQLNASNFNDLEDRIATAFSEKQDTLTAGTGISIVNNVISVSLIDADTQEY